MDDAKLLRTLQRFVSTLNAKELTAEKLSRLAKIAERDPQQPPPAPIQSGPTTAELEANLDAALERIDRIEATLD